MLKRETNCKGEGGFRQGVRLDAQRDERLGALLGELPDEQQGVLLA